MISVSGNLTRNYLESLSFLSALQKKNWVLRNSVRNIHTRNETLNFLQAERLSRGITFVVGLFSHFDPDDKKLQGTYRL